MLKKTYQPQDIEEKFHQEWQKHNSFQYKLDNRPPFTVLMPPPNVTGNLHLGHALTFTLQDILVRFQRMKGRNVLWQCGTDHGGISTQIVVERKLESLGQFKNQLGREKFLEKVWEWKDESGSAIVTQLKKLGASTDWVRNRFTMDEHANKVVQHAFIDLYKKGLIYKDKRLVNWDIKYQTAISDLEVIQKEKLSPFYYLKYPLSEGGSITVATTRPETYFGDVAVAVNPFKGHLKSYIGKTVLLPGLSRSIPIIGDEHSDPEKGSGAVKITPAHDFNDFEVAKRHDLPFINILTPEGHLNETVPSDFQGLSIEEARQKVIEYFEAEGLLEKAETIMNSVPTGEKSGVVIEPRLTDQWYLDAPKLAGDAIKSVEQGDTVFVPQQSSKIFFDWMNHIQPWCISRQLWWGHSIPAWYGPDGQIFVAENIENAQEQALNVYGANTELKQDLDVLDTWFSSSLWPMVTLGWESNKGDEQKVFGSHYPTDVLVTGHDIIFFWVARMMMMNLHFTKKVPFKTVYIHALIKDAQGQKMSKSKGNVIDPVYLMDHYGTDALRFTLALSATPGRDMRISEEKIESHRNFMTKLWNAARYSLMNNCYLSTSWDAGSLQEPLNQWIFLEIESLLKDMNQHLENYRFHEAAQDLYQFIWKTFCDWYVELSKPILNDPSHKSFKETKSMIGWTLGRLCHLLHPFTPFITEEIWQALQGENGKNAPLLVNSEWPKTLLDQINQDQFKNSHREISWVIQLISELRSFRADLNISPAYLLDLYLKESTPEIQDILVKQMNVIMRLGRLKVLEMQTNGDALPLTVDLILTQATFGIPLEGVIHIESEISRLKVDFVRLEKELLGLETRLENKEFIAKAPAEIIEELELRLHNLKILKDKNLESLRKLEALQ